MLYSFACWLNYNVRFEIKRKKQKLWKRIVWRFIDHIFQTSDYRRFD